MKLCKDCKWVMDSGEFAKCGNPKDQRTDRTGFGSGSRWVYCSVHRQNSPFPLDIMFKLCGNRGRWWEPK